MKARRIGWFTGSRAVAGICGALTIPEAASAAETCLPPEPPVTAAYELVTEYRAEILADYERYFSESSAFIACLGAARDLAMTDLAATVTDYEALFSAGAKHPLSQDNEEY